MSATYPSNPVSSLTKSPTRIGCEINRCRPAKRLERVSCKARATASPPTPRAVRIGVIETPRLLRSTRPPRTQMVTLKIISESPVAGIGSRCSVRVWLNVALERLAMAAVTDRTSRPYTRLRASALGRGGRRAWSNALYSPIKIHQAMEGRRRLLKMTLSITVLVLDPQRCNARKARWRSPIVRPAIPTKTASAIRRRTKSGEPLVGIVSMRRLTV